jgi:SAM-dependent methyltransferase
MIKNGIAAIKRNGITYLYKNSRKLRYKPWLGDLFSFLYDSTMTKSVFPKKFEASIEKHVQFLQVEFAGIHDNRVLELATGSGNISEILPSDNIYAGIDISKGLLKIAYKKFSKADFKNFELFLCSEEELPFQDKLYDICICNLSLNFFSNLTTVLKELKRVLKNQGIFICSTPIPERNQKQSVIRGNLHSENELKNIFEINDFISLHMISGMEHCFILKQLHEIKFSV